MRLHNLLALPTFWLTIASTPASAGTDAQPVVPTKAPEWPAPLEVVVPFEPTPFRSGGNTHLVYEMYLRNFGFDPVTVRRVEVFDADERSAAPLAVFEGKELESLVDAIPHAAIEGGVKTQVAAGGTIVAFLWIPVHPPLPVPRHLRHRVLTMDNEIEAPVIAARTGLLVLSSPVSGKHWLGSDAPSNDSDNHHRRGILVVDGHAAISRRFAIDWKQVEDGAPYSGDKLDKRSYYAYGKPVRAVADGTVVATKDGLPDNVPGHFEAFHPAVPITLATIFGNSITLDLGNGQFAHYMHLHAGSLLVQPGDRVKRGQRLAQIGSSGDAREPHLHFELTTSAKQLAGEGLPYEIDEYRLSNDKDSPTQRRTRELPLKNDIVDFE